MARAAKDKDILTQQEIASDHILSEMKERLYAAKSKQEFTAILDRTVELLERVGYSTANAIALIELHE
jgi:hypothetical protein